MIEKDLDKILNYMKQYVENKYEHDSEPMLNWKDLKLVLNEIDRLHSIIKEVREYIASYINQFNGVYPSVDMRYLDLNRILKILNKEK